MSFNIRLCHNNSEENRVTKTIPEVVTVIGELKENTSIYNPSILIEGDLTSIKGVNYAYIPQFDRYYFITDITSVRHNLIRLDMRCDVLMSFKDDILNSNAIVSRNETKYNLLLNDGVFRVYQDRIIWQKDFPQGFSNSEFVLAVSGS